jgi:flagellar motor protein MotB
MLLAELAGREAVEIDVTVYASRGALIGLSKVAAMVATSIVMNSALASTVQLASIDFQPGHPTPTESLADATSYSVDILNQVIDTNSSALKEMPELGVEIAGFSDSSECIAQECNDLSFRRATLVYELLLGRGVPASKLRGPRGYGLQFPLEDGSSDKARRLNPRVQFIPFTIEITSP